MTDCFQKMTFKRQGDVMPPVFTDMDSKAEQCEDGHTKAKEGDLPRWVKALSEDMMR